MPIVALEIPLKIISLFYLWVNYTVVLPTAINTSSFSSPLTYLSSSSSPFRRLTLTIT